MALLREKLLEKINAEYELFYFDITKFSKANIFAKSNEIELKKQITKLMKAEIQRLTEEEQKRVFLYSNILEESYRFALDHSDLSLEKTISIFLRGNFLEKK